MRMNVGKRIGAAFLSAALAVSMVPTMAFAANGESARTSDALDPGTYTVTANFMMPKDYNPILPLDVCPNSPSNPFGPTVDENDPSEVTSAVPSAAQSMNAQLIVDEQGDKSLYLPIKNPIFTTQDLGTCEELPDVQVERVAPTHDAANRGTYEGNYNKYDSRIHKALISLTDDQTSGEKTYIFKGSHLYAVPLNMDIQPEGDIALRLTVDYDSAERSSSSTALPELETEKIVVNVPDENYLPASYVGKVAVYATSAFTVTPRDDSLAMGSGANAGVGRESAGAVDVALELVDSGKYIWSDGSTEAERNHLVCVGGLSNPSIDPLTYTGETLSIEGQLEDELAAVEVSGQTTGVDASTYTVTLTPKEGFVWWENDPVTHTGEGTSDPRDFTWQIKRKVVYPYAEATIKEGQTPEYTLKWYEGDYANPQPCETVEQDPEYAEPAISVEYPDGVTRAEDLPAGTYELHVGPYPLGENFKNHTYDPTLLPAMNPDYTSYLTVEEAEAVAVPQGQSLTYSGEEQTGVPESAAYTVSGDAKATVVDEYTATVTPNPGYKWEDGTREAKQVSWSIEKAPLTAAYAGEEIVYGDDASSPIEYSGFVNGEDETTASGFTAPTVTVPEDVEPGKSYELTPAGGAADNYEFSYSPGTLKVLPKGVAPAPQAKSLVYTGSEQTGVSESTAYELSNATATNAGEYKATATLVDGYVWQDGTQGAKEVTWSIARAPLTATYADETVTYGEKPAYEVVVEGFVGGQDASSAAGYVAPTVSVPEELKANSTYDLTPAGGAADNYRFTYIPGTLTVEALGEVDAPQAVSGLVYNGVEQDSGLVALEHTVLSGTTSAVDAGTYEATFALEDGYVWSDGTTEPKSISWAIGRALLTATYAGETMDVDGEFKGAVEVTGFVNGETPETAAGYIAPTVVAPEVLEAGESYELTPAGGSADNYAFDYQPGTLKVKADAGLLGGLGNGDNAKGDGAAQDGRGGGNADTGDDFAPFALAAAIFATGAASIALVVRRRTE